MVGKNTKAPQLVKSAMVPSDQEGNATFARFSTGPQVSQIVLTHRQSTEKMMRTYHLLLYTEVCTGTSLDVEVLSHISHLSTRTEE